MKVTEKTTLKKILGLKGAEDVLAKRGVPCVSCPFAATEMDKLTIGEICKIYKLDLADILKDLNA